MDLSAAVLLLFPEVDAIDCDGEHQSVMMEMIGRSIAEDIDAGRGEKLFDIRPGSIAVAAIPQYHATIFINGKNVILDHDFQRVWGR